MCGIAVVLGPGAGAERELFDTMLEAISPRGEVDEVLGADDALLGTARLRIVDREHAVQPWTSEDGRWALCFNGEVFNHAELRARLRDGGRRTRSESDTEVVLETVLAWGEEALLRMRGEFAFALVERDTLRVFLARDPVGVKPLYWATAGGRLHVASEVKALVPLGVAVHEVPPGHCGWAGPDTPPALHPYLDLYRLGEGRPVLTDVEEAAEALRTTLTDAVRIRVDTDLRSCSPAASTAHWSSSWCAGCTPTAWPSPWGPRAARTWPTPAGSPPTWAWSTSSSPCGPGSWACATCGRRSGSRS
jgi:asparagine synthase (glutamine-hydrolysing)